MELPSESIANYLISCIGEPNVNFGKQKRIILAQETIFSTPPRAWDWDFRIFVDQSTSESIAMQCSADRFYFATMDALIAA